MTTRALTVRRLLRRYIALALLAPIPVLAAQTPPPPKVFYACYTRLVGAVYRIKEPTLPQNCASGHVQFSWTDGVGANDHGLLAGLLDDDHPQYLLTDGVRTSANGFAVRGPFGAGAIPTTGGGVRLMWYPGKAAFRAGEAGGTQWDDVNVGDWSTATGYSTIASGVFSTAMGVNSIASGAQSFAVGQDATASADGAIAMGFNATASGPWSVAMGTSASTNGKRGSFVFGDQSTFAPGIVTAEADHEFVVRASGGFRFRTSPDLSTGCDLPSGSGVFSCTSSRLAKEHFAPLDPEDVLAKIAGLSIQSWNYKAEGTHARHAGPTAEDFYSAFKLGTDSTAIGTIDEAGISLIAIQALEARTADLKRENEALRTALARLEELVRRFGGSR
jgi:hypothetical protein